MSTTTVIIPDPETVLRLQAVRGYPAVSLLLPTTPAPTMTGTDAGRLRVLHQQALGRLRRDGTHGHDSRLLERLQHLVEDAVHSATGQAVAVFAHRTAGSVVRLPVPVVERVVVDPSFATRDLVRALHRTPRHLVLSLSRGEARLFEGSDQLSPVPSALFPMRAERPARRSASRPSLAAADTVSFLREVDAALRTYRRLHPGPVVVVGEDRLVSEFERVSGNLERCAGTLRVNAATEPLPRIAERCRPLLEAYLLSRQDEALALLERRIWADRAVVGLAAAWLAARQDRPEMLAVEQGLFQAARLSADGSTLVPVDHAEAVGDPDVIDDVVDELIELVLQRGGWVALVDDGRLEANGGVALTLRRS